MRQPIRASAKRKLATRDARTRRGSTVDRSSRRQRVDRQAALSSAAPKAPEKKTARKPGVAVKKAAAAAGSTSAPTKPRQTPTKRARDVASTMADTVLDRAKAEIGNVAEREANAVSKGKPPRGGVAGPP